MVGSQLRALVQPGVLCLLGTTREASPFALGLHVPCAVSVQERMAGVVSSSGLQAVVGAQHSYGTASTRAARSNKERSGSSGDKEEDARLIRVVLRKDLKGLGRQGDVVQVKRGRMRHELYPNGEAAYATPENLAKYALTEEQCKSRDANAQEGVLEKLLRALNKKSVIVTRRVCLQDPERFNGPTVSPENIRRAVLRQLGIQLDPSHFLTEAEIKTYGTFKVPLNLRLPDDQQIELTVHVDRRQKDGQQAAAASPVAATARPA